VPDPGLLLLMLLPLAAAAAVLAWRGARPRDLRRLHVHGAGLLWPAAALQALRGADPAWAAPVLTPHGGRGVAVALWALGAGFVVVNAARHRGAVRTAFVLLGLGFTLNTAATVANDGMPYSPAAGRAAGMSATALVGGTPGHVPADASTRLGLLGDVLPVPGVRAVASVGDVLMVVGAAWVVVALVAPGHRRPGTATPPAAHPALPSGPPPYPSVPYPQERR
jgi:hypothetical protein